MSYYLARPPGSSCTQHHHTKSNSSSKARHAVLPAYAAASQRYSQPHVSLPELLPPPLSNSSIAWCSSSSSRQRSSRCQAVSTKQAGSTKGDDIKEAHKIFDEAVITVRSGSGGDGEIVEAGRGKWVKNLKYHAGANQPKKLWLPASEPADGSDGADVVVVCDPSLDSLLHLHKRREWTGKRGAQGNPAVGSAGPKRNQDIRKGSTAPLEVPVPPGTVVKRKGTGQVLGELIQPGERLLVANGGKGGRGVVAPSRLQKQRELDKEYERAKRAGAEVYAVEDTNWKDDAKGLPGQQMSLQLLLRVVADVGLVGFPNAGKSSLLAALTRASPEVAPYPFTTLMPNLGVMAAGGQQQQPVLADLPGLIEGAHLGKGLGRMFLRHLRRTRLLLHVVDASAADPGTDYLAVREELRMYNPDYVSRPHVVALNKVDLEDAGGLQQEIADEVMAAARQLQQEHAADVPGLTAPAAVVPCSALTGEGLQELAAALEAVLQGLSLQTSSGSSIAQLVGDELQRQQIERQQQRRQQLLQQQVQQQQVQQQQQDQHQPSAGAADSGGGIAAAISAALALSAADSSSSSSSGDAVESSAADSEADEAWEEEYEEEWEEGVEDEEDEGEWAAVDLSSIQAGGIADADDDEEEEEEESSEPAPLPADDPDAWLLELSEEELLKLADEVE